MKVNMEPESPSVPVIWGQLVPSPGYLLLPSWPLWGLHMWSLPVVSSCLHTPHSTPYSGIQSCLPSGSCCILLCTVYCRLSSIPFFMLQQQEQWSLKDPHRCFFLQEAFMDSAWLFCPTQDSPTPVLRAPLPFVDLSLVTYHWIRNIDTAKIWRLPTVSPTNAHLFPKKK